MFKSLKIYTGANIDTEPFFVSLVEFGYRRFESVKEEGDFARRGQIIDIFPFAFELPIRIRLDLDTISSIRSFNPLTQEDLWEHKMAIILPVKKTHSTSKKASFTEEFPVDNFLDLNIGDYLVHNQHGIGRFLGLEKIKAGQKYRDHIVVEYDRQEKLYVPVESMHLVQKYIAFQVRRPKLSRLGTKEWLRIKTRARRGIQKMSWELLTLQAMRLSVKGFVYSKDSDWQEQFEAGFPYKETPGQVTATQEVKADMESSAPMDRLLCGDVGYGKTEVAMRAAFKAIMDNKQVAFLVPTTILAEQHYKNFTQRLRDFPLNVAMLSRFKTKSEQGMIVEELKRGSVDLIIGTHRLLSDDVGFKDLGLVIIDEEQRFGVKHKEKLKKVRLSTDVLTLTATPIPRTLYMSLTGAKDLSVINTPPQNRLPIKTVVVKYDQDLLLQVCRQEFNRKGQVFFIHNRIEDIGRIRDKVVSLLPANTKVAVAHGRMPPKTLEKVMLQFLDGAIDLLVCTMIIQSGIDIPNVNTIIVSNAQHFGLSDLHQLRGRVGRFNRSAYAYFFIPKHGILESDAQKRLDALKEYSFLGAGFKIAMEDLEIRGAGNLLGQEQHGFIAAVGFDLYCRLLREAISTFKKVELNDG